MADLSIQNAFLDGIEEIYSTLFTDSVYFSYLDEDMTETNVYGESREKRYLTPIKLVGRVNTSFEKGNEYVEGINIDCVITIPTKQLITYNIPCETEEDFEVLRKGMFTYGSIQYLVTKVSPRTLIADKWHLYDFHCSVDKKSSLGGD